MDVVELSCPKCGANMEPDAKNGVAVCKYCGYQVLIKKEDTLEEIEAKAQSKSYGYHKGKLKAEAEAGLIRAEQEAQKRKKKTPVAAIVVVILVLIGVGGALFSRLSLPKVNPFACIEVSFKGIDGDGEIVVEMLGNETVDPNRIEYDISKEFDLSLGETISIIAKSSAYRLSEESKTYVVEGLDAYLTELSDITTEALAIICQKAEGVQETNLSATKKNGWFVDMEPVKLFLLTDGKQSNALYVVHEVKFSTDEGNKTYYLSTGFEDVVIRKGAQLSVNSSYGMYYGNSFCEVESPIYITGYDSVEAVRTELLTGQEQYMELKEQDL